MIFTCFYFIKKLKKLKKENTKKLKITKSEDSNVKSGEEIFGL